MESSIEASQTVAMSKPKPSLGPKPRLAPKPFSLQKNATIRSIHAPKLVTATSKTVTQQSGKSEATAVPRPTSPKPARQPATSEPNPSVLTKDQPKTTKESKESLCGEDTLDSSVGKSAPPSQMAAAKEKPKSIPLQQDDIIQTNHKASTDIVTKSQQKDDKKKKDETPTSVIQKLEESGGDVYSTANQTHRQGSTRKRLAMDLTSKFESGGLPLFPHPSITTSTATATGDAKKPESSNQEQNQTTSEPSNGVSDEGVDEDYIGGGSIKRRISLLLDSSSRPEVKPKREEPEMINGAGGVKERIKNWTMETISECPKTEKKLQHVPRPRTKSFEPATPPTVEKTPQMPPAEPPAPETSSSQVVDLPSKFSPAEQPSESPMEASKGDSTVDETPESQRETLGENMRNKLTEVDVQLRSRTPSARHTAADEGDSAGSESAQHALKRDNVKRRSVHFGIVERDDGGPPLILGSESDSSEDEEVEEEEGDNKHATDDEAKEGIPVSVPVYERVGIFQKDDEVHEQEAERLKHLEFEKKRRAEETEEARLKLEEEWKRNEEEEREKERARQMEAEDRERERLKEEEMERQREEEWMRVRLEEDKRQEKRMRKEALERERQLELMLQRQREEEREGAKQKEEMLKQEQEEEERLKEEERLREERERQRLSEEEEEEARLIHDSEEHRLEMKLREKEVSKVIKREYEWEKAWVTKAGRLGGEEEERGKEEEMELMWQRQKEEDRERDRQKEEHLRQEEREKERLREELEERERHQRLKEEQEKEEAMERMKQIEMEEQREKEREEEERKRQLEKERVDELERRTREEAERRRAQELQDELESVVGEAQPNLISFDSEDVPPESESSTSDKTCEPIESEMEVVYEDFSVKQPLIEVEFDDFSVKPLRWGSQGKVETSPVILCETAEPEDEEEVDVSTWENKVPEQVENTDSLEPTLAQESKKEEVQLISFTMKVEEEDSEKEEDTEEDEIKEDNKKEAQGNSCDNNEDKDTDALKDNVPEQQNEACEQTYETDSLSPVPDRDLEMSPDDVDTTDFQSAEEPTPFPECSAPLLDNSAQKSKADLGKRRIRTRPSRSLRAGLSQRKSPDWRTHGSLDETESTFKQRESDSEDEQPKHKIVCSPPPTSQRVPVFPGLSPAALIAQIKRKTDGGGEKTEEDEGREEETQNEGAAPSPSQLPCSPRSAAHLAGAARVLPPLSSTDEGAASCPAWLKELKSKKRLSQYNGES